MRAPGGPGAGRAARRSPAPRGERYGLHLLLFLATLASTVHAGGVLAGRILRYEALGPWWFVPDGLRFGLSLLLFLSVHEFGHYFAARRHRVDTSLPYYIPLPLVAFIGTMGAVIRIREPIPSTRKLFDIGAAGPLAGFVVALGLLAWGLATLPPPTYLLDLGGHEEIKAFIAATGRFPDTILGAEAAGEGTTIVVGQTLLYWMASQLVAGVPPMYEMYHYPVLFAGWLGLFFTALNLLPVGQLDGGHILYALVGPRWHARIARVFLLLLVVSGAVGFVADVAPALYALHPRAGDFSWFVLAGLLYLILNRAFRGDHRLIAPALVGLMLLVVLVRLVGPLATAVGYSGWLVFSLLVVLVIRVDHPPVLYHEPLSPWRWRLGLLSLVVFVLCFSLRPLYTV